MGLKKMPLTNKGKKLLKAFEKEYGKKKGKNVFYAYEHKHLGLKRHTKKYARFK